MLGVIYSKSDEMLDLYLPVVWLSRFYGKIELHNSLLPTFCEPYLTVIWSNVIKIYSLHGEDVFTCR